MDVLADVIVVVVNALYFNGQLHPLQSFKAMLQVTIIDDNFGQQFWNNVITIRIISQQCCNAMLRRKSSLENVNSA